VLEEGQQLGLAARAVGLSRKAARKWIERFQAEGEAGLLDRSSAPRSIPHRTPQQIVSRVLTLRHKRLVAWVISQQLELPRSTVGAILRRHGLGRLSALEPKQPVIRYERESPGELIHLDTKKLAKIQGIGHRIHGDRRTRVRGIGWEFAHLAIDDHTRLSYVEVLPDEGGETTGLFLERALRFFDRHRIRVERILTDNGAGYRSNAVNAICFQAGIRHVWTRPYTPRTNGKAERLVQTLLREWAYRRAYRSSGERRTALKPYLRHYNHRRPHGSLGFKPPIARLRGWHQRA
jgi:transposase InsO family protein